MSLFQNSKKNEPKKIYNVYQFRERVNWESYLYFQRFLHEFYKANFDELTIDFSNVKSAYADGMVPLICVLENLRIEGIRIRVQNPRDQYMQALFEKSGWYQNLRPKRFPVFESRGQRKYYLYKFASDVELNDAVNTLVESALQATVLAQGVPDALEWIANELAGNVLVHAETHTGWIQVTIYKESGRLSVVVCDSGVGIRQSMKKAFPNVKNDLEAMELAIRKEVTSRPDFGQGNGLAGSIAITLEAGGQFSLFSGKARLHVKGKNVRPLQYNPAFKGTFAELELHTDRPISLQQALWGHKPISIFETHFEDDKGLLHFKLRDYATSFGNRVTGQRLRTLVENMLLSNSSSSIEIDFEEVSVISSSFADELFAKLAVKLGVLQFGRRIKLKSINNLCYEIVQRIVEQRIAYHHSKTAGIDEVMFGEDDE